MPLMSKVSRVLYYSPPCIEKDDITKIRTQMTDQTAGIQVFIW